MINRTATWLWLGGVLGLLAGCGGSREGPGGGPRPQVVVYSAQDREFAEPILRAYEKKTGVEILPKFDVESSKTVGLANALIAEKRRPRCDLFWNNEILNTLRLKGQGCSRRSGRRTPATCPRRSRPRTAPGTGSPAGPAS